MCARRLLPLLLAVSWLAGCSGLLFYPWPQLVRTPADLGLAFREVALRAADGTPLHAWWLPAKGTAAGTVYFLHGNAENISTHIGSVYWLPAAGYQVLLLDYRGFGWSSGVPEIPEVFQDIEAGFAWLQDQPEVQNRPLFLLGQSLGASLGGYVAATNRQVRGQLDGVVLDSGFARYGWIAREIASRSRVTWLFQWPIAWSMPGRYDLLDVVGQITPVPLLLIHGVHDDTVPYRHVEALYAAAREPKYLLSHNGPHIGAFEDPANRRRLLAFFQGEAAR